MNLICVKSLKRMYQPKHVSELTKKKVHNIKSLLAKMKTKRKARYNMLIRNVGIFYRMMTASSIRNNKRILMPIYRKNQVLFCILS